MTQRTCTDGSHTRSAWSAGRRARRARSPDASEVRLERPRPHELLDQLDNWLGMESDAAVHFTPEYLDNYDFEREYSDSVLSASLTKHQIYSAQPIYVRRDVVN